MHIILKDKMSTSGAQNVVSCNLCDTNNRVKWICMHCSDLLCDPCKTIHQRGKVSRNHKIVTVKESSNKTNLVGFCQTHEKVCSLFCSKCKKLVCSTCVTEVHTGHVFKTIEQFYQDKCSIIKDWVKHIQSNELPNADKLDKLVDDVLLENSVDRIALQSKIREQVVNVKKVIDNYSDLLMKEIDEFFVEEEATLLNVKKTNATTKEHFEESKTFYETLLSSDDLYWSVGDDIECISKSLDNIHKANPIQELKVKKATFTSKGEAATAKLKDLIGYSRFQEVTTHPLTAIQSQSSKVSGLFSLLGSFLYKGKSVEILPITMFKCSDLQELLLPYNSKFAWIKTFNGDIVLKTNEFLEDGEFDRSNVLDFVYIERNDIKRRSPSGEIRTIRSYPYMRPFNIHIRDDVITVVLVDDRCNWEASLIRFAGLLYKYFLRHYLFYSSEEYTVRKSTIIVAMQTNGDKIAQITCGCDTQIEKAAYSKFENGSIVFIESSKELKWRSSTYKTVYWLKRKNLNGKLILKQRLGLSFLDFDCTSNGTILVHTTHNQILVFNSQGEKLGLLDLSIIGINSLRNVMVDARDRLWIKGSMGKDTEERIYISRLSESKIMT